MQFVIKLWSLMNDIPVAIWLTSCKEFSQWLSKSSILSECALREDTRAKQEELLLRYDGVCGALSFEMPDRTNECRLSLHAQQLSARRKEQIFEFDRVARCGRESPENMIQVIVAHKQKFENARRSARGMAGGLGRSTLVVGLQCAFDALTCNHAALCDDQKSSSSV